MTVEPEAIRCAGRRTDGRSCRALLAERLEGRIVIRHAGRVIVDPASTTCPKCGLPREFRAAVGSAA